MNRKPILSTSAVRRLHSHVIGLTTLTPSIEARVVRETEALIEDVLRSLECITNDKVNVEMMRTVLAQRGYKFCL